MDATSFNCSLEAGFQPVQTHTQWFYKPNIPNAFKRWDARAIPCNRATPFARWRNEGGSKHNILPPNGRNE